MNPSGSGLQRVLFSSGEFTAVADHRVRREILIGAPERTGDVGVFQADEGLRGAETTHLLDHGTAAELLGAFRRGCEQALVSGYELTDGVLEPPTEEQIEAAIAEEQREPGGGPSGSSSADGIFFD
jgi:hypothetical protein